MFKYPILFSYYDFRLTLSLRAWLIFLFISSFLVYFCSVLFTFCLFYFGFQNFQMKTKPLPKKNWEVVSVFLFLHPTTPNQMVPKSVKKNELYFKHDNIAVPPPYEPPPPPSKNSSNASLINWKAAGLRQGLLYRWTEHSAYFSFKMTSALGNYTPGVDFLDLEIL